MSHFDLYYGRPIVAELSDEALLDEAVGIETDDTAFTEWMSESDAEHIRAVLAEAKQRGLMDRVREVVAMYRAEQERREAQE